MATGTATLDFGTAASRTIDTFVVVTGQAAILAGSQVEAYFMADTTTDHSADEHIMAIQAIDLICGDIVPGTGFTIYGIAREPAGLVGQFTVHWVWV